MDENLPNLSTLCEYFVEEFEGAQTSYPYQKLREMEKVIKDFIEGDCHAVVMDGEVLFNTYRDLSHRERITEYTIREQLCNDTHRHLFAPLLRQNRDFRIEVYMFRYDVWKIVIDFNHDTYMFHLSKYI